MSSTWVISGMMFAQLTSHHLVRCNITCIPYLILDLFICTLMILGDTKCKDVTTLSTTSCGAVAERHTNGTLDGK
jgi:hypothetical protein